MNTAINLGECLFTFFAFWIVVYGLWRAHSPKTAAMVAQVVQRLPLPHMSSKLSAAPMQEIAAEPIPSTGIGTDTTEAVPVTRHMNDTDLIVLLASQKKGGKFRFTANKIYTLTGGNHNDVLELIRQIQGKDKTDGTGVDKSA